MSGKSPKNMTPTIMKEVDKTELQELANKENQMDKANKQIKEMKKNRKKIRKNLTHRRVQLKWKEKDQEYKYKIQYKDKDNDNKIQTTKGTRRKFNKKYNKKMKEYDDYMKKRGDDFKPPKAVGVHIQFSECVDDSECKEKYPERPKCLQKANEAGLGSCVSVKEFNKMDPASKVNSGKGGTRKRRRRRKRKTRKRKRKKSRKKRKRRKRRKTRR